MMSLISISNLTFAYEGSYDTIFEQVSFQLDTNWRLAFIGRNGRGKTTFLRLLMGQEEYRGSISASVDFEYFPYPVTDLGQDTLALLESVAPTAAEWEFMRELTELNVDAGVLYRPFSTLSNGEQTKVMLAALFLRENSFLLLDEPTNHLDERGRDLVADYLRRKKGFILVSHDRKLLDQCVDHVLSINRTNIEVQKGNFSSWWENKQAQDQFEQVQDEKLRREIDRLSDSAKKNAGWAAKLEKSKFGNDVADRGFVGAQAAREMKRAKAIERRREHAIEEKQGLLKNIERADALKLSPLRYHSERLLSFQDAAAVYGGKAVNLPVSFALFRGERVALCGKNGCGKSSLLKLLLGQEGIACTGGLSIGSQLKVSYIPQDSSFLKGNLSAYADSCGIDESQFKTILRKLDFERVQFEKDIAELSEGQRKKVLLARSLCEQAHLYIWDEPLNFIDLLSRIQIEELLLEFQPTMLFVEHDAIFREKIATRQIEIISAK